MWTWIDKYFNWLKRLLDHRGIKKQKIARAGRPYEHDWLMKRWHVDRASRKFSHAQCRTIMHSAMQKCTVMRRSVQHTDVHAQCKDSQMGVSATTPDRGRLKENKGSWEQRPPCAPMKIPMMIPGALGCSHSGWKWGGQKRWRQRVGEIRLRNLALLPC
jgi:hypothetical protein